jgi:hypothetical protein
MPVTFVVHAFGRAGAVLTAQRIFTATGFLAWFTRVADAETASTGKPDISRAQ